MSSVVMVSSIRVFNKTMVAIPILFIELNMVWKAHLFPCRVVCRQNCETCLISKNLDFEENSVRHNLLTFPSQHFLDTHFCANDSYLDLVNYFSKSMVRRYCVCKNIGVLEVERKVHAFP